MALNHLQRLVDFVQWLLDVYWLFVMLSYHMNATYCNCADWWTLFLHSKWDRLYPTMWPVNVFVYFFQQPEPCNVNRSYRHVKRHSFYRVYDHVNKTSPISIIHIRSYSHLYWWHEGYASHIGFTMLWKCGSQSPSKTLVC